MRNNAKSEHTANRSTGCTAALRGLRFSLAQRERAGVRENGCEVLVATTTHRLRCSSPSPLPSPAGRGRTAVRVGVVPSHPADRTVTAQRPCAAKRASFPISGEQVSTVQESGGKAACTMAGSREGATTINRGANASRIQGIAFLLTSRTLGHTLPTWQNRRQPSGMALPDWGLGFRTFGSAMANWEVGCGTLGKALAKWQMASGTFGSVIPDQELGFRTLGSVIPDWEFGFRTLGSAFPDRELHKCGFLYSPTT